MAAKRGLFLLVDVHVLSVDHTFVFLLLACARLGSRVWSAGGRALRLDRLVHGLRQRVRSLGEPLARRVHNAGVGALHGFLGIGQRRLHIAFVLGWDLV